MLKLTKIKFFFLLSVAFVSLFLARPLAVKAATINSSFPRLANYFLKWEINKEEATQLAKWDLLVLDMETQENSPESLKLIRRLNPDIIILAYITSQEIIDDVYYQAGSTGAYLRSELRENISDNWWLRDKNGNRVSNWPHTYMLNLSDGAGRDHNGKLFNDYLPDFVARKIGNNNFFDGVFYDNTWGDVAWVNGGNLDLNNDGRQDSAAEADMAWSLGVKKMLERTRFMMGNDFIIAGNGKIFEGYQKLINGMMLESFPSSWENGGTWSGSMASYLKFPSLNMSPQVPIINVTKKNPADYKSFRFGFASALLGNGFYSFDYDTTNHTQTWWYDEYEVNLGPAKSLAYNLLDLSNSNFKPGFWRRDFKFGSVFVNSTDKEQTNVFQKEDFEKIKGTQDGLFNNGNKISYLKLAPNDGIVLLRKSELITNSAFANGYFYRVFNLRGEQVRNGFFSFIKAYPAGEQVLIFDGNYNESGDINIFSRDGQVVFNQSEKNIFTVYPYGQLFKKQLNLAAEVKNGRPEIIVSGTTKGGGPQVIVMGANGKVKLNFFAYNKTLRGGVSVALADVDGDGSLEIITGAGSGDGPIVKIFSISGNLKSSFLAYDKRFRGGVEVATGDFDNDGRAEIVVSPGSGGGPHIRVFSDSGKLLSQFFAYDQNYSEGVKVSVSDINNDGQLEILAGIKNFY